MKRLSLIFLLFAAVVRAEDPVWDTVLIPHGSDPVTYFGGSYWVQTTNLVQITSNGCYAVMTNTVTGATNVMYIAITNLLSGYVATNNPVYLLTVTGGVFDATGTIPSNVNGVLHIPTNALGGGGSSGGGADAASTNYFRDFQNQTNLPAKFSAATNADYATYANIASNLTSAASNDVVKFCITTNAAGRVTAAGTNTIQAAQTPVPAGTIITNNGAATLTLTANGVLNLAGNNATNGGTISATNIVLSGSLTLNGGSRVGVTCSADQVATNATWTVVKFNTEIYDNLGEYDTSTYLFTPQQNGYYFVSGIAQLYSKVWPVSGFFAVSCFKNGSSAIQGNYWSAQAAANLEAVAGFSGVLYLLSTDIINIRVYQNSGADTNLYAPAALFSATRLQ